MSNRLAQRIFNRTKFMQIMKYSVINYWGVSWDRLKEYHDRSGKMPSLIEYKLSEKENK